MTRHRPGQARTVHARRTPRPSGATAAAAALALLLAAAACSTNPATGQRQLALIGEQQEIQMGRQADQQIVQQLGLYPDDELQRYVQRIGMGLARDSERPDLPWTFRVVDDPTVNAFALPGGFIYLTRGILTHLGNEAEMASVLGHEIGHVTARHSVERLSKAQLAQIGLGIGMILSPEFRNYGDLAQTGLSLLFLKYGRDDERQADDLGVRYLAAEGYDPRQMPRVFETLERASQIEGGGRLPSWLSTHPAPGARAERISQAVAAANLDLSRAEVDRQEYLRHLDGVVFGPDPREGYFKGSTFYHPELAFQIDFPAGWKTSNQKQAVGAISPNQDAVVVLTLSGRDDPTAAAREFFSQQGIQQGQARRGEINGMRAVASQFGVSRQQGGDIVGVAAFVEHQGRVYQLLGYSTSQRWRAYDGAAEQAIDSFRRVTDRRVLGVQPKRIDVVSVPSAMTLEEFSRRYPSTVDLQTLALINQAQPGTRFERGTELKRVVGGELPG